MKNKNYYKIFIIILMLTFSFNYHVNGSEQVSSTVPINLKIDILPWDEVKNLIPNKTTFTITDIETGLSFKVQRRAGKNHADVQPLTHKDTQIMKKIYDFAWSWKRRAIIVQVNDQLIAASMHGMPHGAGSLNNGFPGHFCVHFNGSTTHGSNKEDPAHKIMVLKAGNMLDDYFSKVNPEELIQTFAVAVNQEDYDLLDFTLTESDNKQQFDKLVKNIHRIDIHHIELSEWQPEEKNMLLINIPASVYITSKEIEMVQKEIQFTIERAGLTEGWRINVDSLYKELNDSN